jgi:hypothetical protein
MIEIKMTVIPDLIRNRSCNNLQGVTNRVSVDKPATGMIVSLRDIEKNGRER